MIGMSEMQKKWCVAYAEVVRWGGGPGGGAAGRGPRGPHPYPLRCRTLCAASCGRMRHGVVDKNLLHVHGLLKLFTRTLHSLLVVRAFSRPFTTHQGSHLGSEVPSCPVPTPPCWLLRLRKHLFLPHFVNAFPFVGTRRCCRRTLTRSTAAPTAPSCSTWSCSCASAATTPTCSRARSRGRPSSQVGGCCCKGERAYGLCRGTGAGGGASLSLLPPPALLINAPELCYHKLASLVRDLPHPSASCCSTHGFCLSTQLFVSLDSTCRRAPG